jgi:O-antigen/teichoic acid export membrane protein
MLTFGLPLVPSGLAIWILTLLDRYFLKIFTTMEMVGIYSLGYRISSIMSIVVIVPFSMAWSPLMLKWQKEPNAREIYANTFRYFCIGAFFAALVLASLSKEVIMLMTTEAFHNAYKIVYFIVLAYLFHGIYMIFTTGCTIVRKTYFFAIATGIAAIMNTGLNILLIPRFEMMGAAIATVISYFCMTFILYIFSERFYHIPFDFFTFLKAGIIATGLYLAGFIFNANLAISILVKIAILMVYFPLLLIAGVFNKKEIQFGKLILERWLRR